MKQRVLTALALIPPVLAALLCVSPWPIAVLGVLLLVVGTSELQRLVNDKSVWLSAILWAIPLSFLWLNRYPALPETVGKPSLNAFIVFIVGVIGAVFAALPREGGTSLRMVGLPGAWLVGPVYALFILHQSSPHPVSGLWGFASPVLLAVVPLWGGDTAAIFAGKAFGKHPMAPSISPKKTWEGGTANLLACVAVAVPLAHWIGYSVLVGAGCGLAAGILGQAGDLFESWLKRQAGVKDSGVLLPGHGGVLDRIDSILFTAPFVALIVAFAPH